MKQNIHPVYHANATIECSCGAKLTTGSTEKSMHTEICSQCHPFYTGKKKVVDTMGRVERFKRMTAESDKKQADEAKRKKTKKEKGSKAKREAKSETQKSQIKKKLTERKSNAKSLFKIFPK